MSIPKGKLIAIGGAEDKGTDLEAGEVYRSNLNFFELGILRRVVQEAGGPNAKIEIITTASTIPMEVGENYRNAFGKIGCDNVDIMHVRTRQDTLNKEYLQRIKTCDAVMFSGGNQLRLSVTDGGTEFLAIMKRRYMNEDFLIAGTSAGAMAMSKTMIYEGNATRAHLKGEVKITTGLGEDTGMLITGGDKMEAIGSGLVVIIDGHDILHNNIGDIPDGNPISIENLKVHFCEKGNGYIISERKFLMEVSDGAVIKKQVDVE